ncbi:MAG: clostripain-related cysteine peptidase [bacterium]
MPISVTARPKIYFKFHIIPLLFLILFFTSVQARDWTIMVYMCGDNGMNDQVYQDLSEMTTIGSTSQVQIIAQVDNLPSDSLPTVRRYRVQKDRLELIADLGEKNMADLKVVLDFIRFCRSSYPAKYYCLVLWDHGCGWYPLPQPRIQTSIIYDYTNHDSISVADGEFSELLAETKKILGKKLNLLVLDACLMGQIEVASEVKDAAEILVASEALVPGDGFPYIESFKPVVKEPEITPKEFAQEIVKAYADSYNGGSQGLTPVTISAINLAKLDNFNTELSELFAYIKDFARDSLFINARNQVQTFAEDNIRPPIPTDDYIDLYDFLIKTQVAAPGQYGPVFQAFDSLVLICQSVGDYYPNARGLAAWFPDNYLRFKERAKSYENLDFAKKTGWLGFLNQFYNSDDIKPEMTNVRISKVGSRNNFTVYWDAVYDFADVTYELTEIAQDTMVFFDQANSLDNWDTTFFRPVTNRSFSPAFSFFSGNVSNLNSRLELKQPISLAKGGLLTFYAYYSTEENLQDGKFKRDVFYVEVKKDTIWQKIDSFYGSSRFWSEYRYFLDNSNNCRIRFSYKSDSSVNLPDGGIYIDDIKIIKFGHKRTIVTDYPDTSFNVFNVPKDIYSYAVMAKDGFGNKGMVSQFSRISVERYAEPYSKPNPFFTETGCNIYCDYPPAEEPKLYIYSLSGELVKKFEFEEIENNEVYWDGKNQKQKEVGSGIYLVLVKGKNFSRLGKIAKVK